MKELELRKRIKAKVLQWQALGGGKWNPKVDQQMRALDREIDELYEQLEDKNWNWYDEI